MGREIEIAFLICTEVLTKARTPGINVIGLHIGKKINNIL